MRRAASPLHSTTKIASGDAVGAELGGRRAGALALRGEIRDRLLALSSTAAAAWTPSLVFSSSTASQAMLPTMKRKKRPPCTETPRRSLGLRGLDGLRPLRGLAQRNGDGLAGAYGTASAST